MFCTSHSTAAVAQWVRALAPQAEGWVFKAATDLSRNTSCDSNTAKRSAKGVGVTGPLR